jgi:hypothetical protein
MRKHLVSFLPENKEILRLVPPLPLAFFFGMVLNHRDNSTFVMDSSWIQSACLNPGLMTSAPTRTETEGV